jgi:hypothetical protein
MPHMAMTAAVKDELSRVDVKKACCRKAELSALLRFSSALHLIAGHIVIEADLDAGSIARRVKREIFDLYGHDSEIALVQPAGLRKSTRYLVRVVSGGDTLARQSGIVDSGGRPVRGLSPVIIGGGLCDCEAAWRGAFLAHGSLTEPGRSSSLEITCPGAEAALALVGCSRDWERTNRSWRGRSDGCGARSVPPPIAWPTSTMPICVDPREPRWRPVPACSGRWRSWERTSPDTSSKQAGCAWSTGRRAWRNSGHWPTPR